MNVRSAVAVGSLALSVAACTGSADAPERRAAPVPATQRTGALPRLVFFMNPNGAPCQIQDRVLRQMGAELSARAELVYFRTTEPGDIAQFAHYGIRSLPALVLTDASGREVRRSTPGIQSAEQVRQLLGP